MESFILQDNPKAFEEQEENTINLHNYSRYRKNKLIYN